MASDLKKEAFLKKQNIRLLRLTDVAARRVADQEWIVDEILEPTEPDALVVCNPADEIYTAAGSGYAAARCSGPRKATRGLRVRTDTALTGSLHSAETVAIESTS